jgi:hypothetical protein
MYEKAEPIGRARCPHVLDVELGAQSRHHGGVTMLCLSSTFIETETLCLISDLTDNAELPPYIGRTSHTHRRNATVCL